MKSIYISLPITGQEETYEARLNAAVAYVKKKFPDYDKIVTPKDVAEELEETRIDDKPLVYKEYLLHALIFIAYCDAVFLGEGWRGSKGCRAEVGFANAIGVDVFY
ncbi:MAG: DUF4406 domain-containing protein [Paludibacteraceae bacterium]